MSDTPITDRAQARIHEANCLPDCDSYGHNERCPYASPEVQAFETARQLERMCNELYERLAYARDSVNEEINTHINNYGTNYPSKNRQLAALRQELESVDAALEDYKAMKAAK